MSTCASCGRQRSDDARFCGGCGAEFTGSPEGGAQGAAPEATRIEPPAPKTDPFASWYQQSPQPAPPSPGDAGSTWQPTQTVSAAPAQAAGYHEPRYPASAFSAANPFSGANPVSPPASPFPPGPPAGFQPGPPAGPPDRGGKRGLFLVLAVIVVLAAGGGAYALATTLGKHSTAQPPAQPTTSAPGSPAAGGSQQASTPAASASPSTSATPSPTLSLVAIPTTLNTHGVGPQVETLLSHYFHGINSHSYPEYAGTLTAEQQAKQTQAQFNSGYSSTTDSGMTLTSLSSNGSGLTATVTFTSRQSPSQSVDKSACNAWTLNLYLVPQGGGYLIGSAPSGYSPTYSDC